MDNQLRRNDFSIKKEACTEIKTFRAPENIVTVKATLINMRYR